MGATEVIHMFSHHNWRQGVRELQEEATEMYGHGQGYSGKINSISEISIHRPSKQLKSHNTKALHDYVYERLRHLGTRQAEVIQLELEGYSIAKPVIKETRGWIPFTVNDVRGLKEPSALFNDRGFMLAKGTKAELKERAFRKVLQEEFSTDYYLYVKSTKTVYRITGEGKIVKSTTQKSTDKQLVLPIHKYIVYGLAPS